MPFEERSVVDNRREFVLLAGKENACIAELCRRFGVSRKTGYKWLKRAKEQGEEGLEDQSRRPVRSPRRTPPRMEERVLELRDKHGWGGRKIHHRLLNLGHTEVPSPSTATDILRRHDRLDPTRASDHRAFKRFEREAPNELWQMDFKGHFELAQGNRCHPLTVLDDHSRYSLVLSARLNERGDGVRDALRAAFLRYGLPDSMLVDNGPPWGGGGYDRHGSVAVWLMQLDIGVSYARVRHPQTIGKDERFHRTLKQELLTRQRLPTLECCQQYFDEWRRCYNFERPHESLEHQTPSTRYEASRRSMPDTMPVIEYDAGDAVRKVQAGGRLHYRGHTYRVGKAFTGRALALRPADTDGDLDLYFGRFRVGSISIEHDADV